MTPRKKALLKHDIFTLFVFISAILAIAFSGGKVFLILLGMLFILVTISMLFIIRKQISDQYCPKCGVKYIYEDDVEWEVAEESFSSDANTVRKNVKVEFTCTCHQCEHTRSFVRSFQVGKMERQSGRTQIGNLENIIRKRFS